MATKFFGDVRDYSPTPHALTRMAQRNIQLHEIWFVMTYGKRSHRAGAIFVQLRQKDIPFDMRHSQRCAQLVGTTLVLSREKPVIVTVYRNRQNGFGEVRRKSSYTKKTRQRLLH